MKILLVAATAFESTLLRTQLGLPLVGIGVQSQTNWKHHKISLLTTGIGMVNTAFQLGRTFADTLPELAVQFGIAGSYTNGPALEEVVELQEDCFGELGADSPEGFIPLENMGFANFEWDGRSVFNRVQRPNSGISAMRQCKGVTVNRVSGTQEGISWMEQMWAPEVETMEGAAFFQACLLAGVPFHALRGISNRVEPRNRANWKVKEAAEAVQKTLIKLLEGDHFEKNMR